MILQEHICPAHFELGSYICQKKFGARLKINCLKKMFLDWNFTKEYSFFLFLSSKVLQNDIKCCQIGFKTSQTCLETFKLSIARRIMHRIIVDQFLSNFKKIHFFTKNPYDAELQKFLPQISQTHPHQKITNVACLEGCKNRLKVFFDMRFFAIYWKYGEFFKTVKKFT